MLELYRTALRLRKTCSELGADGLSWLDSADGVLAFSRPEGLLCMLNVSAEPQPLPPDTELVLASGELSGGLLPSDTAVWLRAVQ